jgi:hypothetical protein
MKRFVTTSVAEKIGLPPSGEIVFWGACQLIYHRLD